MDRQVAMRFNDKVEDWLDEHHFHYLVRERYFDSELSIFTFSIKEIPLITFSIWHSCFPRENGQSTTTPQPFLFADFDYSDRAFNPSSAIYSPLYEKWRKEQKLVTEQDAIDWLCDLLEIVHTPQLINEKEDVSQEYVYNLGKLALTENYEKWHDRRFRAELNAIWDEAL